MVRAADDGLRIHPARWTGTTTPVDSRLPPAADRTPRASAGKHHRRPTRRPRPAPTIDGSTSPTGVATPVQALPRSVRPIERISDVRPSPPRRQATSSPSGYVLGVGRTVPSIAAGLGLISVVIGGLALSRSARRIGRTGAVVALVLGLISAIVGGLHTANSAGGLGTGNGLAGAIAALALGLIGLVLGGLAVARSRRTAAASEHGAGTS